MAIYEFYRFKAKCTPNEALLAYREEWNRDFPNDVKHLLNELGSLPFYDMIERFITVSVESLDEKENAYRCITESLCCTSETNTVNQLSSNKIN